MRKARRPKYQKPQEDGTRRRRKKAHVRERRVDRERAHREKPERDKGKIRELPEVPV